jgi:HEAT repeat protein
MTKKSQRNGARPGILLGLLLLVGVVVGTIVFSNRQSPAPAPNEVEKTPAPTAEHKRSTTIAEAIPTNQGAVIPKVEPVPQKPTVAPVVAKGLSVDDFIKTLQDGSQSMKARAAAAKALAKDSSNKAFAALRQALLTGSHELRTSIADALGGSTHPETSGILMTLINDRDEHVAKAAVRALAEQGGPEAVNALSQILYNNSTAVNVRSEAASGLGNLNQPGAADTLSRAALTITDERIVESILQSLGGRPIEETQGFFQSYFRSPTVSSELKLTAIDALGEAKGDASALLMEAARDTDPEIREKAAWALSAQETQGKLGSQLTGMLQTETDPDVRRRLYQALGNQESFDVSTFQSLVQKETDRSAKLAGLEILALQLRTDPSADLASYFDRSAVAELKNLALHAEISQDRMSAVNALKRAGTASALAALQDLAFQSTDKRVLQASRSTFGKVK